MQVASFLDPRHKEFKLRRLNARDQRKYLKGASQLARGVYEAHFMGDAESQDAAVIADAAIAPPAENPIKRQKLEPHLKRDYAVNTSELLGRDSEDEAVIDEEDTRTDWEKYEDVPQVSAKTDLLKWWSDNADKFPSVARMAMQVHGCPACSSGVGRLFSKAGRNHSSQQKGLLEDNMADLLFSSNTY